MFALPCASRDNGLQDAPNMYELLVNNKIVDQELPILRVYDKVWRPAMKTNTRVADVNGNVYEDLGLWPCCCPCDFCACSLFLIRGTPAGAHFMFVTIAHTQANTL